MNDWNAYTIWWLCLGESLIDWPTSPCICVHLAELRTWHAVTGEW